MPPSIVIFGPPGAPVAELAAGVAERLAQPVRETDADLARQAGCPVGELMVDVGEAGFRCRERRAVREALADHTGVLVIGSGAVLDADTRADLAAAAVEGAVTVFVDTGIAEAARRLGFGAGPTVALNPRATWSAMMRGRRPLYEQVATVTVASGLTTSAAIDLVLTTGPGRP